MHEHGAKFLTVDGSKYDKQYNTLTDYCICLELFPISQFLAMPLRDIKLLFDLNWAYGKTLEDTTLNQFGLTVSFAT